ncbi:MAG: succinate dehydrogenase cytochrome b subunit [Bryobacterales bacterium]|nr:succinate dehydrogenase cytochrome b subunit [Bryobacterales bacterium]
MSAAATALTGKSAERFRFWDSPIGKKAVMAATGFILFGFVTGHMLGNLQIYLGPEKLDAYAEFLQQTKGLLWGARITLLICVALHVTAAIQLALLQKKARPQAYVKKTSAGSSYASRTMYWSGPILLAFIVFHLLHFTTGQAHPDFQHGAVYRNVVTGFQSAPASLFYIVAMLLLGAHLYHGIWSMFQSVGINHPKYTPVFKKLAALMAAVLVGGNVSIPVAVMTGLIR